MGFQTHSLLFFFFFFFFLSFFFFLRLVSEDDEDFVDVGECVRFFFLFPSSPGTPTNASKCKEKYLY